jgi:uncharacterized protein related to proFAR isomerase
VTDTQIIATAVVSVATAEGTALYVGYLADHTADIAAGWAEGCEWLVARRRGVRAAWVATAVVRRAVALAVLRLVLRPHGQHRRAVSA